MVQVVDRAKATESEQGTGCASPTIFQYQLMTPDGNQACFKRSMQPSYSCCCIYAPTTLHPMLFQASSTSEGEPGTGTDPSPRTSTEQRSTGLDRPLADALAPLVVQDSGEGPLAAAAAAAAATPFAAAAAVAATPFAAAAAAAAAATAVVPGSGGLAAERSGGGGGGAGGGDRRRGLFGFVSRLFGALGGKEATETLVRTASFR